MPDPSTITVTVQELAALDLLVTVADAATDLSNGGEYRGDKGVRKATTIVTRMIQRARLAR